MLSTGIEEVPADPEASHEPMSPSPSAESPRADEEPADPGSVPAPSSPSAITVTVPSEQHQQEEQEEETKSQSPTGQGQYICQICFGSYPSGPGGPGGTGSAGYRLLGCGHEFCRDCLRDYLTSKVSEAQVYPVCFHSTAVPSAGPEDPQPARREENVPYTQMIGTQAYRVCNHAIGVHDLYVLLSPDALRRYETFKFCKENKDARECPYCHLYQLTEGTRVSNAVTCVKCSQAFCWQHSNAHPLTVSCEAYELQMSGTAAQRETMALIEVSTKPCPACGVRVMKTAGCNHMKCSCGQAFCWICGQAIDDTLFPAHFQWWNPLGCSNMQMNEAIEPSRGSVWCAKGLAMLQCVVFGPLTVSSTLVSSLLCGCCLFSKNKIREVFAMQMSFWGVFWMMLLVFLPLALILGSLAVGLVAAVGLIIYPCYACIRVRENHYPWPDEVTNFFSALVRCCCCCRCGRRPNPRELALRPSSSLLRLSELGLAPYPPACTLPALHGHPLILTDRVYSGSYGCDICGKFGHGLVYHCDACKYDAHPACAWEQLEAAALPRPVPVQHADGKSESILGEDFLMAVDTLVQRLEDPAAAAESLQMDQQESQSAASSPLAGDEMV